MNFGIKQTVRNEDFKREILAEAASEWLPLRLYLQDGNFALEQVDEESVSFVKGKQGRTEVEFAGTFTGGEAIVTLLADGVPFFSQELEFGENAPTYFSFCKTLFFGAGKHTLSLSVNALSGQIQTTRCSFVLCGGALSKEFVAQVSFDVGYFGEELYVTKQKDGFYFGRNTVDKNKGILLVFEESELPQKVKVKYFAEEIYFLYKTTEGVWKICKYNQTTESVGNGVVLVKGSDCDFYFKTVSGGDVYFVSQGELYRFSVTNLFDTPICGNVQKVVFEEVKQKVKGVFVSPYDFATEDTANYLVVWGVSAVVLALVSCENSNYYTSVVKVLSESNACTAFVVDNIFMAGALKNGLLVEHSVTVGEEGTTHAAEKKRYCSTDAVALKTLAGFVLFEEGKYFLI